MSKGIEMNYLQNTSYIFMPFTYGDGKQFKNIQRILNGSKSWTLVHDEIKYMLKFVADKIDSRNNGDACLCFHYQLNEDSREQFGLGEARDWFSTAPHLFQEKPVSIRFQILGVQLYCFSTGIGLLAFELHFASNDPYWIANAQYYLKKVSRESLSRQENEKFTFLDLSRKLIEELKQERQQQFFFYANASTERANFFTFLEVPDMKNYQKQLFYLRRCYSEGFLYIQDDEKNSEEIFRPSKDIMWGISPEAGVCLVCTKMDRKEFLQNTFYPNFNAQYLFMYVLLLHQKYVLYQFLTEIGVSRYNDLEMLEEYRQRLYDFETDFVFSYVTEVPQYQELYDRVAQSFALRRLFEDVHEPLNSLADVRREAAEEEQEKRELGVNRALLILSVFSFFSVLMDSFQFVESFFGLFSSMFVVRLIQYICVLGIGVVAVWTVKNLIGAKISEIRSKKKHESFL